VNAADMLGTALLPEKFVAFLMQSSNTLQLMFVHFSEGVYKNDYHCCCCYLGKGCMSIIVVTGL
jgi:hypothetical protein